MGGCSNQEEVPLLTSLASGCCARHAAFMTLPSRLRDLDDRVLRDRSTPAREDWGRRHGWSLFAALGFLLLAFGLWAMSIDRPAMAGLPIFMGAGLLAIAVYLFVKRKRT